MISGLISTVVLDENVPSILDYTSWTYYIPYYLGNVALLLGILLGIILLVTIVRNLYNRPFPGSLTDGLWQFTERNIIGAIHDFLALPFGIRRVWSIAKLCVKEAVRRNTLYVFAFFLIPLLFGGWYVGRSNTNEGQVLFMVVFVNNAMTWLLIPLCLFLVSFSLPNDIQNKTVHTIVTKPVRPLEIIIGRILGFMIIFTGLIAVMGVVGLYYVKSQVSVTKLDSTFPFLHMEPTEVGKKQWVAREPVYATNEQIPFPNKPAEFFSMKPLIFMKDGASSLQGTHVGREWGYRSYIEGSKGDAAHWFFHADPKLFEGQKTIPIQFMFDIFKTTKGDPTRKGVEESGIRCTVEVWQHPDDGFDLRRLNLPLNFSKSNGSARKAYTHIALPINNNRLNTIKVPTDAFSTGYFEVRAECLTRSQFLGMAPNDLYVLTAEKSFEKNFFKGLLAHWLRLLMITSIAVCASTVLKGFITTLFTAMTYTLGVFFMFMWELARQSVPGGGPFESLMRLFSQQNPFQPLDDTFFVRVFLAIDQLLLALMGRLTLIVPNLSSLDTTAFVAEGYDIPSQLLVRNTLIVVGYVIPAALAGYFMLKNRELASS